MVNTAGSPLFFRPSTMLYFQCPKVILSVASDGCSSMDFLAEFLEILGFLSVCRFNNSGNSNSVTDSRLHNRVYRILVQGILLKGNRCSCRTHPTQVSNNQSCGRTYKCRLPYNFSEGNNYACNWPCIRLRLNA